MARFLPPALVSALFVLWAPFIGEIRTWLRNAFPGRFGALVAGAVAGVLLLALLAALLRIRTRRVPRYAALAASVALFAIWIVAFKTGTPEVDAVERVHFIEYGLIALLFYRAARPLADPSVLMLTLLSGLIVGTLEEWVQWFAPRRVGDARDVFLNLYAIASGLVFAAGLWPMDSFSWRVRPCAVRRTLRLTTLSLVLFAGFFHCAHLGYEIRDEEIGRFRSSFTAEQLRQANADRARVWKGRPPSGFPLLGKEDFFLTEGGWHAQARNNAYAARDFAVAWSENRILEKYFDAFLDIRSFSSGALHRWAPEQRAEVEAALGPSTLTGYVSQAGFATIFIWPTKLQLWAFVLLALVVLPGLSSARLRRPERMDRIT